VATAGQLCRNKNFQAFVFERKLAGQEKAELSENGAKLGIYEHLGITSRRELKENKTARDAFYVLVKEFEDAL